MREPWASTDRVRFAGHVSDFETLSSYYWNALVSVSPGYAGLSLIQSHWFGVPMIIARDEPHAPEIEAAIEGENAVLVTSDSSTRARRCAGRASSTLGSSGLARGPAIAARCVERYAIEAAVRVLRQCDPSASDVTSWTLLTGCAVVLALPLAWRVWSRRFDPFEPIVLFALAWGAMFVARPAAMLVEGERSFWGVDVIPTLPRALALALLGAVAFVVGYEVPAARRVAPKLPQPRPVDSRIAAVGALVTSVVALVALAIFLPLSRGLEAGRLLLGGRTSEFGELLQSSSAYVVYGSVLIGPAAVVLDGARAARPKALDRRSRDRLPGLTLVRVLPAGGRIVLLPIFGSIAVLIYVMRGTRPRVVTLVILAAAALLISFFILHLRDPTDDFTLRTAVEELRDRPQAVFDPVLHDADAEMVLALSAALTVIPEDLSYRYGGATIGNLLARPVPRELWPGKPLPPSAEMVATVLATALPGAQPAFSPLLAFYWDLGILGVAAGMALFGLLCRTLYEWFRIHQAAFAAQLLFAASIWLVVVAARNDPVDSLVLAAFSIGPVLAIVVAASEGVLPNSSRRGGASAETASPAKRTGDPRPRTPVG